MVIEWTLHHSEYSIFDNVRNVILLTQLMAMTTASGWYFSLILEIGICNTGMYIAKLPAVTPPFYRTAYSFFRNGKQRDGPDSVVTSQVCVLSVRCGQRPALSSLTRHDVTCRGPYRAVRNAVEAYTVESLMHSRFDTALYT